MAKPTTDWRKRILVPFWAIRICLMLVVIIGFSIAMSSDYDTTQRIIRYPAAISFLFFTILVVLLDVLQVILWSRNRLHPAHFTGLTMVQTAFWGLVLLMDIISIAQNRQSPRAVGLVVIIFLLYLGLFLYALRGYLKQRRLAIRGHYTPANDAGTTTNAEVRYSESTFDPNEKQRKSAMYRGGDLGDSEPLYTENYGPVDHYVDRPTKFAAVV